MRRINATLHRACLDAVRSRLLPFNPCDDLGLSTVCGKERKAWDSVQLREFLTTAKDDRLAPLWLLYATTGARRG